MPDERFRLYGAGREPLRVLGTGIGRLRAMPQQEGGKTPCMDAHPLSYWESEDISKPVPGVGTVSSTGLSDSTLRKLFPKGKGPR